MTTTSDFRPAAQPWQRWQNGVLLGAAFWCSSLLILDFVIMPCLFMTGMMADANFAIAGYTIFWTFNRIELLCAAVIAAGVWVLRSQQQLKLNWIAGLALGLLAIALLDTYILTPEMSALSINLDLFDRTVAVPDGMGQMHSAYWFLDLLKLVGLGSILKSCWR